MAENAVHYDRGFRDATVRAVNAALRCAFSEFGQPGVLSIFDELSDALIEEKWPCCAMCGMPAIATNNMDVYECLNGCCDSVSACEGVLEDVEPSDEF